MTRSGAALFSPTVTVTRRALHRGHGTGPGPRQPRPAKADNILTVPVPRNNQTIVDSVRQKGAAAGTRRTIPGPRLPRLP